jgi:Holliday junction resolvasome RuvABC endonuclease subunit
VKMFAGIDFGKVTSVQVDLGDLEPKPKRQKKGEKKAKTKRKGVTTEQVAARLVRLDDFLALVLTSWEIECVGLEIPPGVRDQKVFQQLSMYYGLALARVAKVEVPCKPLTVTEWRKLVGIRGKPPKELKQSSRTNWIKGTVIKAVNRHTGSAFEMKDHDRADGVGVALATAVVKGAYDVNDEIWCP